MPETLSPTPYMKASRMIRVTSLGLLVALASACSADLPSAPAHGGLAPQDAALAKGGSLSRHDGVVHTTFTIQPDSTKVYKLSENAWVYIPANATCTLDTPYGTGEWNNECVRATTPITVNAVVTVTNGIPSTTFYPDLRFGPAADGDYMNWVFLGMKSKGKPTYDYEKYAILYRPTGSLALIDESLQDATLRAFRYDGYVVRRLKHFSGYNVSLGFYEEQSADPYSGTLSEAQ
jgi:hypothetical protein